MSWLDQDASDLRLTMYQAGRIDREIAAEVGVHPNAIQAWRKQRGLPANNQSRMRLTVEQRAARLFLYNLGYTDRAIAREQGVRHSCVFMWRKRMKLRPNGERFRRRKHATASDLLARIKRAIGRHLARDVAEDAVADLYIAVVDGTVSINAIEAQARRFGNKAIGMFASKFGHRSLDEEMRDDGAGFRMIDMQKDDSSSDWLEEMGATVW